MKFANEEKCTSSIDWTLYKCCHSKILDNILNGTPISNTYYVITQYAIKWKTI